MLRILLALVLLPVGACLHVTGWTGGGIFPISWFTTTPRPALVKRFSGPESRTCDAEKLAKRRAVSSVVGGSIVNTSEKYAFLSWIGDAEGEGLRQYCGGTLISERIVLTAAHCLYLDDKHNEGVLVRVGVANFLKESGEQRMIVNWRRHQGYSHQTMENDIALMLLNASVENTTARPIRLSDGAPRLDRRGLKSIVGWGSMDEECEKYDANLREANITLGSYGWRCQAQGSRFIAPRDGFDIKRQMCAGNYRLRHARYPGCGDSGGPLLARDNGTWVQVGLVSWSYGFPYPDVFTRVSAYRKWINETSEELLKEGAREHH